MTVLEVFWDFLITPLLRTSANTCSLSVISKLPKFSLYLPLFSKVLSYPPIYWPCSSVEMLTQAAKTSFFLPVCPGSRFLFLGLLQRDHLYWMDVRTIAVETISTADILLPPQCTPILHYNDWLFSCFPFFKYSESLLFKDAPNFDLDVQDLL